MKKKIILALCSLLIIGGGIGVSSLSHEEQPVSQELLAEIYEEEEPEETIEEEAAKIRVCEKGCTLETGHEGDCVIVTKEDVEVILKSTSVERDLKVKFVNKSTGKLISGADFKMQITGPSKKAKQYSDHDNDGIIWVKDIDGGKYTVKMLDLEGFITAKALSAEVKKKIEYKVIEIEEEVKDESQVEVSKEDAAFGGTDKDESTSNSTALKDTVEFVASSKQEIVKNTEKQLVDEFGQKVYEKMMLDRFGNPMFAKVLEEVPHAEGDVVDGKCDHCGEELAAEPENPDKPEGGGEPEGGETEGGETEGGETQKPEGGGEPEQPEVTEETPTPVLSFLLRPYRYLKTSGEANASDTCYIRYDTASAPVYDTTSEPVYETEKVTVYYGWQTLDGATYYFDKNGKKVTGQQVIQGISYTFSSEGVRSGTIGIDVSKYQKNINWKKVKNAGINFVMIRCGYRGYGSGVLVEDPMYRSHIQGAKAAGLRVGVYFFSQAINEAEAVEEASMAVKLANKYGINMPIAIDSEYANKGKGRADKLSKSDRTTITKAFCNTVKSAGHTPMVYASKSWFQDHLNVSQLSSYRIWVAHYADKCGYKGTYHIWQNTDKGKVDGVPGSVDMNISSF